MRVRIVPIVHGCDAPVHRVVYAAGGSPTHVAPGPARTLQAPRADWVSGSGPRSDQGEVLTTWNDVDPGRTRVFAVTRSGGYAGIVDTVVGPAPRCFGDGS